MCAKWKHNVKQDISCEIRVSFTELDMCYMHCERHHYCNGIIKVHINLYKIIFSTIIYLSRQEL